MEDFVVGGKYKNSRVGISFGRLYITKFLERHYLTSENVASIQLVGQDTRKSASSSIGRGIVGGVLLGPVGLIGGAVSGKNKISRDFLIEYRSGEQSVIRVSKLIYPKVIDLMSDINMQNKTLDQEVFDNASLIRVDQPIVEALKQHAVTREELLEELRELFILSEEGLITEDEYIAAKERILGSLKNVNI